MKVVQLCLILCHPMDYTVHGILQARILEWVAFPFSRESSQPRDRTQVSHIAGGFFTSWATREAQKSEKYYKMPLSLYTCKYIKYHIKIAHLMPSFPSSFCDIFRDTWKQVENYISIIPTAHYPSPCPPPPPPLSLSGLESVVIINLTPCTFSFHLACLANTKLWLN